MKRLLSLFTILCCVFSFVTFPVAVEAEVVPFTDNFETETDTVPDNWSVAATSLNTTATVETENGNKFLRLAATAQRWTSSLPSVVTKDNLMEVPLSDKKVLISYKTRMSSENSSKIQFYMRAGIPGGASATTEIIGNNYKVVEIRRFTPSEQETNKSPRTSLYYYTDKTYPNEYTGISLSKDVWYEVKALMDPTDSSIEYTVGNKTAGYVTLDAKMEINSLSSLELIDNLSAMMYYANAGAYMDIDDVYVGYAEDYPKEEEPETPEVPEIPEVPEEPQEPEETQITFADSFETETDTEPDNWSVAATSLNTTATVETENGNKFLRLQATAQRWSSALPCAVTKDNVVSIPLADKNVLVRYKTRMSINNSSKIEFYMRAGIPGGASATTEIKGNNYKLVEIRRTDSNSPGTLRYYTTNTWPDEDASIKFEEGKWYDISVLINPVDSTVKYIIANEDGEYVEHDEAKMEPGSLASLDVINNLAATIFQANAGAYMDIDDVYVGYPEDYPTPSAPYIRDLQIIGEMSLGGELIADYRYYNIDGAKEKQPENIQWLYSDTPGGIYELIPNATERKYTVGEEYADKFISVRVTPESERGIKGDGVVCDKYVCKASLPTATVKVIRPENIGIGDILTGYYVYSDINPDDSEGDTICRWLILDKETNEYKPIKEGKTYEITEDDCFTKIKFEVKPVSKKEPTSAEDNVFYSEEINGPEKPYIENLTINVSGKIATVSYDYKHPNGVAEGKSIVKWYVDGNYKGESESCVVSEGSSIKVEVTPIASKEPSGETVTVSKKASSGSGGSSSSGGKVSAGSIVSLPQVTVVPEKSDKFLTGDEAKHWGAANSDWAIAHDYMAKEADGLFKPDMEYNRQNFLTSVLKMVGMKESLYKDTFNDVEKGEFANLLQSAVDAGIISVDENFNPQRNVSREEVCKIIVTSLTYMGLDKDVTGDITQFTDSAEIGLWAEGYIAKMLGTGLMQGTDDGRFMPKGTLTKAQTATILRRLSEYVENVKEGK